MRSPEPPIGQDDILMDYYGGTPSSKKPRGIVNAFKPTDKEVADDDQFSFKSSPSQHEVVGEDYVDMNEKKEEVPVVESKIDDLA